MSRSFITGGVSGLVLSVLGLATASLVAPLDRGAAPADSAVAKPETAMIEVPEGSEFSKPPADAVAAVPADDVAPVGDAPAAAEPAKPAEPALPETESAAAPAVATEAPDVVAMAEPLDAPVTAEAEAPAPVLDGAPALSVEDRPKPLPARVSGAGQQGGAPAPGEAPLPTPEPPPAPAPAAESLAEPAPAAVADLPEPATTAPATTDPATTEPATTGPATPEPPASEPAAEAPAAVAPAEPEPEPAPEPASEPTSEPTSEPAAAPEPAAMPEPEASALPRVVTPAPDTGLPGTEVAPITDVPAAEPEPADSGKPRIITLAPAPDEPAGTAPATRVVPGVKILRLPGAGAAAADAPAAETAPAKAGPLTEFAARWTNPGTKPLLAVVILDQGAAGEGLSPEALASLPFAATIAIDPLRADAAATEARYRAAGSEVAILAGDLPAGATPADMEVAYQSYVQALPESVALIGRPEAGFQRSSLDAQHMAALLAADGRGFVTYQAGLNPAKRAAEKAGAPVATVGKLFASADAADEGFGRELDRVAFEAVQKGTAVIALPATPEMLAALTAWAGGPSGAAVTLAPVSALMIPATAENAALPEPPETSAPADEPASTLPGKPAGTLSDNP